MPEHMSVVGVDIIIATEAASECIVQRLMVLSSNIDFYKDSKNIV
jgi:hypothetical protein